MSTFDYQEHPDRDVQSALIRLCDALCTWERGTGRQNLLVLIEEPSFEFIADGGKPIPDDSKLGMSVSDFVESARNRFHN